MRKLFLFFGLAALVVLPSAPKAEEVVLGIDSSNVVRIIKVDSSGNIIVNSSAAGSAATHAACTYTSLTVGTTAVSCPSVARSDRRTLTIQMRTAGSTLTVRTDGSAATSTAGIDLGDYDIYTDDLVGTVNASCICTGTSCSARIVECP